MKNQGFHRGTARLAGLLYLLTFVSIPTLTLYANVKSSNYVLSAGSDTSAIIGALLEITIAVAGIATAVVLYPILKKYNDSAAIGLVSARILESATIFVGVSFILTIVTLHKNGDGANALATSHALATLYDRLFLLGQSFMPAICDMLLGYLLLTSRLVPKKLAQLGIVAGPILLVSYILVFTGTIGQHSALAGLCALPVALFEFIIGLRLFIKGFDTPRQLITQNN